jgi:hypothetical protein
MPFGRQAEKYNAMKISVPRRNMLFVALLVILAVVIQLFHVEKQNHRHRAGDARVRHVEYRPEEQHLSGSVPY